MIERRKALDGALVLHVQKVQSSEQVDLADIVKPRRRKYLLNFTEQQKRVMWDILSSEVSRPGNWTVIVEGDLA